MFPINKFNIDKIYECTCECKCKKCKEFKNKYIYS